MDFLDGDGPLEERGQERQRSKVKSGYLQRVKLSFWDDEFLSNSPHSVYVNRNVAYM